MFSDLDNELYGSREWYHRAWVGTHNENISAYDTAQSRNQSRQSVVAPCLIAHYLRYWVTCDQFPANLPCGASPDKRQGKKTKPMRYPKSIRVPHVSFNRRLSRRCSCYPPHK